MIYDSIKNISILESVSENFARAVDFIRKTDLDALPVGKTEICGKEVYVNKFYVEPKSFEETKYESHKKYADIQIDLSGNETVYTVDAAEETDAYNDVKDVTLFRSEKFDTKSLLRPGKFVLFLANEIHKPGVKHESEKVLKCVFKIGM